MLTFILQFLSFYLGRAGEHVVTACCLHRLPIGRRVIDDGVNGFLVDFFDSQAIARRCADLLKSIRITVVVMLLDKQFSIVTSDPPASSSITH